MRTLANVALCTLLLACGPPNSSGGDAGGNPGASNDAGSVADTGSSADAGPAATPTICDLYDNNVFAACMGCHGRQGGVSVDLSSAQALHDSFVGQSGNSGNPLVVSGDAEASWLWVRMNEAEGQGPMPPAGKRPVDDRNAMRDWINGGDLDDCL